MFKWMFRLWLSRSFHRPTERRRKKAPSLHYCRPGMEILEDRTTPAQFFVNALTDTGAGSSNSGDLLYCINSANSAGGYNTILFTVSGQINLSTALPSIADNLSITNPSNSPVTINAATIGSPANVFIVNSGESLSLTGLTITGGSGSSGATDTYSGGGIYNNGTLTVNNCVVTGNAVNTSGGTDAGGGIINVGAATVANSTISANLCTGLGAGICNVGTMTVSNSLISGNYSSSSAGGIYNSGTLTIISSTISGNGSTGGSGAGIYNGGSLSVSGSTFSANSAKAGGGGLYNISPGVASVTGSTFSSNSAVNNGGAINNFSGGLTVSNSIFSGNTATSAASQGGAINVNTGTLTLSSSTISNNSCVNFGGGVCNLGTTTISSTTISSNTVGNFGGGVASVGGTLTISGSTISGNSNTTLGGGGGGIINVATLLVSDSTIASNSASGGGGLANQSPGVVAVIDSTFTGNNVYGTGDVGGGIQEFSGSIALQDTIVAGNTVTSPATDPDFAGTVNSSVTIGGVTYVEGYNLIGNNTGSTGFTNGLNGDQVGTSSSVLSPQLGPLQNNGGTVSTMAPLATSPAVNAGDPNVPSLLPQTDARGPGFPRTLGSRVDIGAFETAYLPSPSVLTTNVASTVVAGQSFNFQVDVQDAFGNLVTTDSATMTATLSGPGSFTSGSTTVQVSGGIASFIGMSIKAAGSYTLQISDAADGVNSISPSITVAPGSPAILSVASGSGQSATVGAADAALQVELTDAYGNPISGASVAFTAPSTGASVALGANPTTNSSGLASVSATANTTAGGPFTVTASADGLSTSFQLTNTPASPSKLVFLSTPPSTNTAVAGGALPSFRVAIEDSNGNVVASDSSAVTISLNNSGTLIGAVSVNAANGIAAFSGLSTQQANAYNLQANDSGDSLTQISTPITILASSPAVLSVSSGSGQSKTVSGAFTPLQVKLTDAFGNPISGASVTFTAPSTGASASLGANPTTNSSGLASVSATANATAGAFTVTASANGLSTSFQLTNNPGAASKLVFLSTLPSTNTAVAGGALPSFQAAIEDSAGNVVTSDSSAVTVSLSSGALIGAASANAVAGIATFSGLTTELAGANTLQVADSSDSLTQISTPITILVSSPAVFSVSSGSDQSKTVSGTYAALQVKLTDAFGNPISGASVTFTAPSTGASVSFAGNPATTNASGLASATPTANTTAGAFTVTASADGLSTSFQLTNNPGAASKLVFLSTPPSTNTAVAGGALPSFQAAIEDSAGNVVTSDSNAVTVSLSSGALIGAASANAVAGIATFSGLTTELAGANTLQVADSGDSLTQISTPITILAGSPAVLSVSSGSGQSKAVSGTYAALQVKLTDAFGNPISGASVTFTAPSSGASVSFVGNPATTNASGVASVTPTANTTAGAFTVTASADGLSTTFQLTNSPGSPGQLVFINAPPSANSAIAGSALSTFQVAIEDSNGNVLTSDTNSVTISLNSSTLTGTSSVKAVGGVATFTGLETESAGSYLLQANDNSDSLTQITTPITINDGSPAILSVLGGSRQSVTVGAAYAALQVKLTDAFGNPISGASVTFTAPSSGASVSFAGNPATTNASGVASVTPTANTTAGALSVTASTGNLSTTFSLTNSAGSANKLVFLNTPPSTNTADAGQTLPTFGVAIEDSDGNVVTSDESAVTVSLSGGTLTGNTSVDAVNGVATFSALTTGGLAGANNLQASDASDGLTQISTPISINAGSPAFLSVVSGSEQSIAVGDPYAALQVELTDAYGNPISGASITFAAPASGASVTFTGNPATTNSSGVASVGATANTKTGAFTVTAAVGGLSASFLLTNSAGSPSKLVFLTTPPSTNTAVAGGALPGFEVAIEDSHGNVVTSDNNTVSVSLSAGSLNGAVNVSAVDGIASFNGLTTVAAGADTLEVNDGADGLAQITAPISINPGSPAILGVVGGSGQSAAVGAAYQTPLEVELTDTFGNPISGASVAFAAPTSGASVTFSGNPATTNSSGLASVTATGNATAGGPFTVTVSADNLSSLLQLTNTAGAASKLVFLSTPTSSGTATAGQALPSFQVAVEDSHGNVVAGDSSTLTVSLSTGSLTGATNISAINGIATFTGLMTQTSGVNSLLVNDSSDGLSQITTPISIDPGSGDVLSVVSGSGQSAAVGAAYMTPLQVRFTDAYGNPISGASVTFSAPGSGAAGTFSGAATVVTNAEGVATAPTLTAGNLAGNFTVTATVGSLAAGFSLTNTASTAASIVPVSGTVQNTVMGKTFATPLEVQVTDSFGNPASNVAVTFSAPTTGSTGAFSGAAIVLTNAQGIATAPTLTANALPGSFSVRATAAGVSDAVSFNLTITSVPATIAVSKGSGQKTNVNSQFASPLQAIVTGSNKKPVAGITVVFQVSTAGPGGEFAGAVSAVTNASGVATAPVLIADAAAGSFTVLASVVGVATPAKFTLTNTPAAAASIAVLSGSLQNAAAGKAFARPLEAEVLDSFGNLVSGVTVTFTAPGAGSSGTFSKKSTVTAVTNASGIATATAFTANATTGSFTVTASAAGVATPASFSLSNVSAAPAKASVKAGSPQSATVGQTFGTALQVLVTDSHGNPISGVWVTFSAPTTGPSGLFNGSATTSVQTNASGIAAAPAFTADAAAGNFTVTATVSGVAGSVLFSLTNLAGAAAAANIAAGNSQSIALGGIFTAPLVVSVTDSNGNAVSNATVTFTIVPNAGAGGTFSGGETSVTVVTSAQGIAIAPVLTANDVSGSFTVDASINGGVEAVFTLTNL